MLDVYLRERETLPFSYEPHGIDCGRLVGGWMNVALGTDLFQERWGAWSDEAGAMAVIAAAGTLNDAMTNILPLRDIVRARVGDIVSFPNEANNMTPLGICLGQQSAFLTPTGGYARVRTMRCDRAWSIL